MPSSKPPSRGYCRSEPGADRCTAVLGSLCGDDWGERPGRIGWGWTRLFPNVI